MRNNQGQNNILSAAHQESKKRPHITYMLEVAGNDVKPYSRPFCQNCSSYAILLKAMNKKQKMSSHKWDKLKEVLNQMEVHNYSVVENTDRAVQDFEHYIIKLEAEIIERDQIISTLAEQIQKLKNSIDDLSVAMNEQKERTKQIQLLHKIQVSSLKDQILRQASQKVAIQHKLNDDWAKIKREKSQFQDEYRIMEQEINRKQKLIKFMSTSNNQLLSELIELRSKVQMDISTCSGKQKNYLPEYQQMNKELRKENKKLLQFNQDLQLQIKSIIRQTENMETMKAKLEKEISQRRVQEQRMRSIDLESRYNEHKAGCPNWMRASKQAHGTIRVNNRRQITTTKLTSFPNPTID